MKHAMKSKLRAVPSSEEPMPAQDPASAQQAPLTSEVVNVTPEMATKWLERNHPNNRAIAWQRVEAFTNDMRAGAWKLTHQAICFDADGVLIDGQHRLQAVVQSGAVVQMLVVHSAIGSYHDPIDRVGPRSIAVITQMNHRDVAALNLLRMFEVGFRVHTPMTLNEANGARERHLAELTTVATIPGRTKLTGPVIAAIIWALPCSRERVIDWAVKAASGEMIGRGNPAYAFRSWRERNRRAESWDVGLAALNCLRFAVTETNLANVTVGEAGYRAFCAKRRALKIANTPGPDIVPGAAWTPQKGDDNDR